MPGTHPSTTLDGMWLSGASRPRPADGEECQWAWRQSVGDSWQELTCTVFRRVSWSEHIERSHRFSAARQIQ
jgi:hypothetical protein